MNPDLIPSEPDSGNLNDGEVSPFDPFHPDKLRVSQKYLESGGAKKLLTRVPVGRPHDQEFFRVHPAPEYRISGVGIIKDKQDRESYLIMPDYFEELPPSLQSTCTLYLVVNHQKILSVWDVKLPGSDGRINSWHSSAHEAAEYAMKRWIRIAPNQRIGGYDIFEGENQLPVPEWSPLAYSEILKIAFKGRVVDGPDHPLMQKLRGAL